MTELVHNYSNLAGKTVLWDTSDDEEAYRANTQDPVKRQQLQDLGYLDCDITYSFNRDGFRTAEFDRPIDVVCFGCSFTYGSGVGDEDTWPYLLGKKLNLSVGNFGTAGMSIHGCLKQTLYGLENYNANKIIILLPNFERILYKFKFLNKRNN